MLCKSNKKWIYSLTQFILQSVFNLYSFYASRINNNGIVIPTINSIPPRPHNPFLPRVIISPVMVITMSEKANISEKMVHPLCGL